MDGNNFKLKKTRVFAVCLCITAGIIAVLLKLYEIQVTDFKSYQDKAIQQQTADIPISAQRGIIYDRNMKILASNAPVEQVFISPAEIKDDDEARLIAQGLSEILGVDYDEIYAKTQKVNRRDENIKHRVEISAANKVREFKIENGIDAIYFRPETKRIYPNSSLAAQVIGFTGSENEGRFGIEYQYDEYLRGVPGRIITAKNALGKSMNSEFSTYIVAQNGNNVVLTIDWAIQSFLEKNLEAAFAESQPRERVTGIIMDVNNGEILAMATVPSFDLNNPGEVDPEILGYINLDGKTLAMIENSQYESEEAKEADITKEKLLKLWNNKAIIEPYEPGSTFKVITAAMALEEKAVKTSDGFYCSGSHVVAGIRIPCHLYGGHGNVSFAEGLQQSCNPVLMQTAERIGNPTFLKYFDAFGYNQKTGVDLPWETGPTPGVTIHKAEDFRTVELATASFGQRFKVTPIQQLTGIAAVANGGKLVTPHVVKSIVDNDGNVIKSFDPEIKRMVISEETAKSLSRILAEGVSGNGAARNAFVKGYEIAAKTGTSQKEYWMPDARIGSCVAYAPADNPQVAIIIIVDEPTVGSIYGGVIAAPYVSRTLADVLPYLGIEPTYADIAESYIVVKNYGMQKVANVTEDIISRGLKYTVVGGGEFVREQIPKAGSSLLKGGNIILYTDNIQEKQTVMVPEVTGMTAQQANKKIIDAGLNINIIGAEDMSSSATALRQEPSAGEEVPIGTIVSVEFRHNYLTD